MIAQVIALAMLQVAPARVHLVKTVDTLHVGEIVQLEAEVRAADGTVRNDWIAWRASTSSYVSLAANGRIRGIRPGRVTISAIAAGDTARFDVHVVPSAPDHSRPPQQRIRDSREYIRDPRDQP